MSKSPTEALAEAIDIVGGLSATARGHGIKPQAVGQWEICPATRVLKMEELTGGKVSRHDLRPDLYGPSHAEVSS